jgi:hypothetical protein
MTIKITLLGCDAVWSRRLLLTLQRNITPLSSGQREDEASNVMMETVLSSRMLI